MHVMDVETLIENKAPRLLPVPNPDYYMYWDSIKLGDIATWRHQGRWLDGVIVALLEGGVEATRPAHVKVRQWRVPKRDHVCGFRRAVLRVVSADGKMDSYYEVKYHRLEVNFNSFCLKNV